jgi:prevent-host-death family protein
MTRQVTATEAKAKLLSLLDQLIGGDEVEITRHGRTVARLVPATGPSTLEGRLAGIAITAKPDDDLLSTETAWDLS